MLEINNLSFSYDKRNIFNNINLSFDFNTFNLILGESSVGKTTLLSLMTGNLKPDEGKILYNGKEIDDNYKKTIISYIDQDAQAFDNMKVIEHFKFISDLLLIPYDKIRIRDCLKKVGLDDRHLKLYPKKLSGGERKRFLIALALYKKSKIIFLDEPTSALDDKNTQNLQNILFELVNEGYMIIVVSHDRRLVNPKCNICEILNNGNIIVQKRVISANTNSKSNEISIKKQRVHLKYFDYKNKIQKILLIVLLVLGVVFLHLCSTTLLSNYQISKNNAKVLENATIKQIHLRKKNFDTSIVDGFRVYDYPSPSDTLPLSDDELLKLKKIANIDKIYKYQILLTNDYENNGKWVENSLILLDEKEFDFEDETIETVPFYSFNQEVEKSKNYISNSLAQKLGVSEKNLPINITVPFGIPVGQYYEDADTTYSRFIKETNSVEEYLTTKVRNCNIIYEKKDVTLQIDGIVEEENSFDYFMTSPYYIAMDNSTINKIINQYNGKNLAYYKELYQKDVTKYECNEYLIDVDELDNLIEVEESIKEINNLFDTNAQYSNVLEIGAIEKVNRQQNIINNSVLIITFAGLFSFVIYHYFKSREKEILLLSRQGLTPKEIIKCFNVEMIILIILMLGIGIIINAFRVGNLSFYLKFRVLKRTNLVLILFVIQLVITEIIYLIYRFSITKYVKRYLR